MRIAVVGSGIAGLTCAYELTRKGQDVVLYERLPAIGMGAHGTNVGGHAVDIPLRVFNPLLWRHVIELSKKLGIDSRPVDIACSFTEENGDTLFRYTNVAAGMRNWPIGFSPKHLPRHLEILFHIARLKRLTHTEAMNFGDYLQAHRFPQRFVDEYLLPTLGTICTCSNADLRAYPADILVDALSDILVATSLRRVVGGTPVIVAALADTLDDIRLSHTVEEISIADGKASLRFSDHQESFDHVVIAAQANHAVKLMPDGRQDMRALLRRIPYVGKSISVHRDVSFLPRAPSDWSPLNFAIPADRGTAMSTILINRVDDLPGPPILQTWNPLRQPRGELFRTVLERPVVTADSRAAVVSLLAHSRGPVWLVGSYAEVGIPLLESGIRSAMRVVSSIVD